MIVAGSASPLLLSSAGGYNLTKSLRFRSSASAYLNRTFSTPTNNKKWTWSGWIKRGTLSTASIGFFGQYTDASNRADFYFDASDNLNFYNLVAGSVAPSPQWITTQVFRDPSAWYHIIIVWDSDNATAGDRIIIYVNGSRVTAYSSQGTVTSGQASQINSAAGHNLGRFQNASTYFDGYLAEVNFIDGQALTPSSFGETSTSTGVWIPKKYTGTYGTNGFYLPFTDVATTSGSNAGLGKDFSGNANYWTTNNISVTTGTTYDSMSDVPTLTSATAANYAVLNPLTNGSFTTLNGGNLNTTGNTSSNNGNSRSSFAFSTGKWYAEFTVNGKTGTYPQYGIMQASDGQSPNNGSPQSGYGSLSNSVAYLADGTKLIANSNTAYGSSYTTGDVIGIAVDADNGAVYFSKNGTFQNSGVPTSGSSKTGAALTWTGSTVQLLITIAEYNGSGSSTNFGQQPFAYTPPTGFVALNTFNLPTPTIGATASTQANDYFNAVTYTGTGATQSITGLDFQPDFVWIKSRNNAGANHLIDAVRGIPLFLFSDSTAADTSRPNSFTSFNSNGFTVGSSSDGNTNLNTYTYVAWNWKANGSGSSNTAGSITSTVSANTTAGFSIVTYTGNGTIGATIGHGLGVAPSMLIVKQRTGGLESWQVYHSVLGATQYLQLNSTGAAASNINRWNNTAPTSTVFTVYNDTINNGNTNTYVAYCFAEVAGYSAFGSYTGNGSSDGPFVFTGFRPRYVLFKRTDTSGFDWFILDTARNTYNVMTQELYPNLSLNELTANDECDFLSNGFKIRRNNTPVNANGGTYIYAAFAESPFKYANAR